MGKIFTNESFKEETIHHIIYQDILEGSNVYIQGLSGTGKTQLCSLIANKLNFGFYRINMSNNTVESNFIGEKILEDGKVVFKHGMLPQAMGVEHTQILYKKGKQYKLTPFTGEEDKQITLFDGIVSVANEKFIKRSDVDSEMIIADIKRPGILLIDEYDTARPEYLFVLQSILEKDGYLTISENFGEVINKHRNFRIVATGNTFGRGDELNLYNRQELDISQLDRYDSYYKLDYSKKENEILEPYITKKFTNIELKNVLKLTKKIREMINNGELKVVFSTRRLISLCKRASNIGFKNAFYFGFYNFLYGEEKKVIAEIFYDIFNTKLIIENVDLENENMDIEWIDNLRTKILKDK
jgi:MoxR-like ATPase